jgi:hypothetical protein
MKKSSGMSNLDMIQSYVNGERPFVQIGYDSNLENVERKNGEQWVDSLGKKWEFKNGYKKRISNTGTIINEQRCTECQADTRWGDYLDDQVWPKTGLCFECYTNERTKLKIKGTWELTEKLRNLKNTKSMIMDMKLQFEEAKEYCEKNSNSDVKFLEEDGSEEKWIGKEDFSEILENINGDLEMVDERLKTIDSDINECELKIKNHESSKSP